MTDIQTKKRKWVLPLLSAHVLSFTACVFAPLESYYSVGAELWFDVGDFILPTLLCFLVLFIALFGVGMLFRGKGRTVFCALLFGLSVQGGYANADYGVLDGRTIDWSAFGSYPLWNTLMWAVIALVPVGFALRFHKSPHIVVRFLSARLTLILVSTVSIAIVMQRNIDDTEPSFITAGEFTISKGKNVVVFVLTRWAELLVHEPIVKEQLQGFTWLKNMVGQYPVTTFAMPALLTGESYYYESSKGAYMQNAWKRDTFLHALKADGYHVDIYTESEYAMEEAAELIDNLEIQPLKPTSEFVPWQNMARLTAFRYAPHIFKYSFVISTMDFDPLKDGARASVYTFDDVVFLNAFYDNGVSAIRMQPGFKLYHLQGAHTPYNLKLDGTRGESTLHEQILTQFNAIYDYLKQMKAQNVYDAATIVITADHGNMTFDPAPLLLIKRPGDSGALAQNNFLVYQQDIHATIAAAAGLTNEITYGNDAFSITEDDIREANYYNYYWKEADRFYEYSVTTDDENELLYQATGRVLEYGDVKESEIHQYERGTQIRFENKADIVKLFDEKCSYFLKQGEEGVWFDFTCV